MRGGRVRACAVLVIVLALSVVAPSFAIGRASGGSQIPCPHEGGTGSAVSFDHPIVLSPVPCPGDEASTYLGGTLDDSGENVWMSPSGAPILGGWTLSADFPVTPGAYDVTYNGGEDLTIAVLSPDMTGLAVATYLGGSGKERYAAIAQDALGNVYVAGGTFSSDFPTTAGAFDTTHNGLEDIFLAKFDPTLSTLLYSTFLGGSGHDGGGATSIGFALDADGNAYLAGSTESADFPVTAGAFDTGLSGINDAFVAKFDAGGSLVWSTYFGGGLAETAYDLALDVSGSVYVTGLTTSSDMPTTAGAFDTTHNTPPNPTGSGQDAFVAKFGAAGNLVYSTYLGGTDWDRAFSIAVDGDGNAYVTGQTQSGSSKANARPFPTTAGAFDTTYGGLVDGFVTKLNPSGSALVYSTFLGGHERDWGMGIAVNAAGNAYVAGRTASYPAKGKQPFPVTAGAFDTVHGGTWEAFMTKLAPDGSSLAYSTLLGGSANDFGNNIALDAVGAPHTVGVTLSSDFPTTAGAFDTTFNGVADAFVVRL